MLDVLERHNVRISGHGRRTMIFAHGFGCDQNMWRWVAPAFEERFRVVVFDHVGCGGSDLGAFDRQRHARLEGYAGDVVAICRALDVQDGVFVGHSVSAMIGVLAARQAPDLFGELVLIGPSPRYLDDPDNDYVGGFSTAQIEELLDFLDSNHMGWSQAMAPAIMGNADRPALAEELANSFCRTDPEVARHFARTTFLSDNRRDLEGLPTRALVLQCAEDVIAPEAVGRWVHARLPNSQLVMMAATGHCPNLSAPAETVAAINAFV